MCQSILSRLLLDEFYFCFPYLPLPMVVPNEDCIVQACANLMLMYEDNVEIIVGDVSIEEKLEEYRYMLGG